MLISYIIIVFKLTFDELCLIRIILLTLGKKIVSQTDFSVFVQTELKSCIFQVESQG